MKYEGDSFSFFQLAFASKTIDVYLFKNKKEESHGISLDPIYWDSLKIQFPKEYKKWLRYFWRLGWRSYKFMINIRKKKWQP